MPDNVIIWLKIFLKKEKKKKYEMYIVEGVSV